MNTPAACPRCGTPAPTVLRFRPGVKYNRATMQCNNPDCGHVWAVKESK